MEAKFTRGPWEVVMGRADIGGHGHTCWVVGQKDGDVGCAVVILPDEDDTPGARVEREATANLVAASPLLYAALEAVDNWSRTANPMRLMQELDPIIEQCRNALRAARGE